MGFLMLDIAGTQLERDEEALLASPMTGGLILFSRNFENRAQLNALIASVRRVRPDLLIAVDHEGGRVQRFREGFTQIPAMGDILPAAGQDLALAKRWATELGFLMAVELLASDIDLSFAPVLDVNGVSDVIGRRAFSSNPDEITELADAFIRGMESAGMKAVGKHFPGHGSVKADSHVAMPVDSREASEILNLDMQPFKQLIGAQRLDGVMPAHVVYDKLCPNPAGFSSFWLQEKLRGELGFDGVIFSDDLGMEGAAFAGDYPARAHAALSAGCDMILVCNNREGALAVLAAHASLNENDGRARRNAAALRPDPIKAIKALDNQERWEKARELALSIGYQP
ncbi:beta-N-acetylhexosaminidase [Shewanella litorisediminis]|uniref:Beta-hexosaminidase n=1 Tax=Shewanella litorisediminis TaxID=1173586 RepID=A0ABX7G6S2_9GAMM|nr:beta-N-acetylhexosaminidase [Shewanella litorisediminis]MCL2916773.1 beta-N-acetylhexosaminidase [Shewanella litorisediminis]QRH03059.1 beta-N-acetylhexosaminidase [Shewanella litorisediminis]